MSAAVVPLTFTVIGDPQPKGSTKILPIGGIVARLRRGSVTLHSMRELMTSVIVTSDNPQVKSWQSRIAFEATTTLRQTPQFEGLGGAVSVQVEFFLPRPTGLPKSYAGPHLKKPDVDKLVRSLLDALTGILWPDDSRVTAIVAGKAYAGLGEQPRAVVTVRPIAATMPLFDERTGP